MESTSGVSSELHPSTQIVLYNDDLLTEILLRLPVFSLHLFKSVSKRWSTLITNPNFTFRRTQNPSDPPSGILSQRHSVPGYHFVPLDTRIQIPLPFGSSLNSSKLKILQSCNGLLLCHDIRTHQTIIYNPTINQLKTIPKSPYLGSLYWIRCFRMAFDPSKSSHYKILCATGVFNDGNFSTQIQIYSSKTCNWSVSYDLDIEDPLRYYIKGFSHGLYWNDGIHWLNTYNTNRHIMFDIAKHSSRAQILPADGKAYRGQKLFESRGCLLLIRSHDYSQRLIIYEMRNWDSGWSVKNLVYLSDIMIPFSSTRRKSARCARWFGSRVRSVVIGDKDEDLFLVMEIRGKIVKYSIGLKTFFKVYEPDSVIDSSFQFIASFSTV